MLHKPRSRRTEPATLPGGSDPTGEVARTTAALAAGDREMLEGGGAPAAEASLRFSEGAKERKRRFRVGR